MIFKHFLRKAVIIRQRGQYSLKGGRGRAKSENLNVASSFMGMSSVYKSWSKDPVNGHRVKREITALALLSHSAVRKLQASIRDFTCTLRSYKGHSNA